MRPQVSKLYNELGWLVRPEAAQSIQSLEVNMVHELLASGGVVLFRGFSPDVQSFVDFSDRFSTNAFKHNAPSVRRPASDDGTITEVLLGNHHVHLHGEMYYLPRRPDLLWLLCVTSPTRGGATTVCSGAQHLSALSDDTRRAFRHSRVSYHCRYPRDSWIPFAPSGKAEEAVGTLAGFESVRNIVHDAHSNMISFEHVMPAITRSKFGKEVFVNSILNIKQYLHVGLMTVTFEDGSEIPEPIIDELKLVGNRIAHSIDWMEGDLLVIENSSVMHGHESFSGPRKILTRFTNVLSR